MSEPVPGTIRTAAKPPTLDEVRTWGATCDVVAAGAALGLGRNRSYELARSGDLPVRCIRIGRTFRVVTAELVALLEATARAA